MNRSRALLVLAVVLAAAVAQLFGARRAEAPILPIEPTFSDIGAGLTGVHGSSVAWGDCNSDGRLDILLTGGTVSGAVSRIYKNNGNGTFSEDAAAESGLIGVTDGSVAWGDYNSDGKPDILLTGGTDGGRASRIYKNNGNGTFSEDSTAESGLTAVDWSSVAWGDYNSDGKPDILLTGLSWSGYVAKLYKNNGNGTFSEDAAAESGLIPVDNGSVAWGDYNSDGRLDILLTGEAVSGAVSKLYKNNGSGSFSEDAAAESGLTGVSLGSVAWGDYNSDGRPDILLTGGGSSGGVSKIYKNNGSGSFSEDAAAESGLAGVYGSSVAWGDYNADGKPDILLTGYTGSALVSKIYENNGNGSFSEDTVADQHLTGVFYSSVAWGDYNPDGKLDILLTGEASGGVNVAGVYHNLTWTADTAPSAPANLTASPTSGSDVTLGWNAAADTEQSGGAGLSYNLRVGTTPGASDVVSPLALADGTRLVPKDGNAGALTSYALSGLTAGATYYWSVQAIDSSFAGSGFATEGSFTMAPVFAFSAAAYSIGEAGGHATVTINRSSLTATSATVHFATANGTAKAGSDYTAVDQTVTFAAGETSKTVPVPITDDTVHEANETVQLSLSSPSSGATLGSPSSATLTITDNDVALPPPVVKSSGKIVSCKLTKKSFPNAQARKVKLTCKFSPKSKLFRYVLSIKKGKKWSVVKRVSKTSFYKVKYTATVKKLFAGKAVKRGRYRLKLSADKNSKTLKFRVR
jgi:hypothetical protein